METSEYKLIVTIVNKGKAERIAEATHIAGAEEGTILLGHGTALRLLLGISIEPEREILLTIVEKDKVQRVIEIIGKEVDLTQPHKGIVMVLSPDQLIGIHKDYS